MIELSELHIIHWFLILIGALVIGISRTGIRGSSFLVIPLFAYLFGGQVSAGLVLVALMTGDLVAIRYYLHSIQWSYIWRLLPWAAAGVLLGVVIGERISGELYDRLIAVIIIVTALMLLLGELQRREVKIGHNLFLKGALGTIGGFSSMIGNAAGPIMNLYFLSMQFKKERFIGTVAWFFFLLNVFKVPFHLFAWQTITPSSLLLNLIIAPFVLLGTALGVFIARRLSERVFRWVIVILSIAASIRLFVH